MKEDLLTSSSMHITGVTLQVKTKHNKTNSTIMINLTLLLGCNYQIIQKNKNKNKTIKSKISCMNRLIIQSQHLVLDLYIGLLYTHPPDILTLDSSCWTLQIHESQLQSCCEIENPRWPTAAILKILTSQLFDTVAEWLGWLWVRTVDQTSFNPRPICTSIFLVITSFAHLSTSFNDMQPISG